MYGPVRGRYCVMNAQLRLARVDYTAILVLSRAEARQALGVWFGPGLAPETGSVRGIEKYERSCAGLLWRYACVACDRTFGEIVSLETRQAIFCRLDCRMP
jgi:hypothetical protein